MADFNKVILMGNLTKDPEVRYTPSGTAVGDFSIAINRKYRGSDGSDQEETCFVDITVWSRQAETCGEYLRKGSPVLIEGRLKLDRWEKDGQKHSRLGVVAERVKFLSGNISGGSRSGSYADGGPATEPASPAAPAAPVSGQAPSAESAENTEEDPF